MQVIEKSELETEKACPHFGACGGCTYQTVPYEKQLDMKLSQVKKLIVDAIGTEDGMIIHGGRSMHGTQIKTYADHRIAMSFAIAGLAADGVTTFDDPDCVVISYPNFYDTLQKISS